MLKSITIRNLAVIESLACEFGPGLTVFTGETGAGKSVLLDALGLALGDRADADAVRTRAERADVTAVFDISQLPALTRLLEERGLDAQHECILQRQIKADGGSRAFCNGTPVTVQTLRDIGDQLIDLHGQHSHQSLLRRPVQRQLLDEYGRLEESVAAVKTVYARWIDYRDAVRGLIGPATNRDAELSLLQYQLDELTAQVPEAGELDELIRRHQKLAHVTRLAELCDRADTLLDDDDAGIRTRLVRLQAEIMEDCRYAPDLTPVAELLRAAEIQINEARLGLRDFHDSLDADPATLQQLDQHLGRLHDLARKHHVDLTALADKVTELTCRVDALKQTETRIRDLQDRIRQAVEEYRALAGELSRGRQATALRMADAITAHMRTLGMAAGRFDVAIHSRSGDDPAPNGDDECEFLVSTNPDQDLRPIAKVASGGELSRISLAIRVVVASDSGVPVLIYDEVDAGIGGAVAEIVAQRLHDLSRQRQVLCITHLPQVACYGDQHFVVNKELRSGTTCTSVTPIRAEERVIEIARMLGGIAITQATVEHARELLTRV